MPSPIPGSPVVGKHFRGGVFDAIAPNHDCKASGLPNGSTRGAVLESSVARKASRGDSNAMREMASWSKAIAPHAGEICEVCGRSPNATFRIIEDTPPTASEFQLPGAKEKEYLRTTLALLVDPRVGEPDELRRLKRDNPNANIWWLGRTEEIPPLVQMSAQLIVSWLTGKAEYAEFIAELETKK